MANDLISALFDGECSGPELDRLLEDIERSPELRRQWSRLCAVRGSQEGVRIAVTQRCICAGVMEALDEAPPAAGDKVVDLAVRRAARGSLARFWKPAISLAAAASMGAAAVLLVRPAAPGSPAAPGLAAAGQDVALGTAAPAPDPAEVAQAEMAHKEMLRGYWMEHRASLGDEDVGSQLRDARLFAERDYRPVSVEYR